MYIKKTMEGGLNTQPPFPDYTIVSTYNIFIKKSNYHKSLICTKHVLLKTYLYTFRNNKQNICTN